MAEAPINFNNYGHQVTVIKLEPWVKTTIMDNVRIIPRKCRPVLKRALQTGFIEDLPRFEAAFDILLSLLRQRVLVNISQEDREAAREAERLQEIPQEAPLAPDHEAGAHAIAPESESLDDLREIPEPLVMEPLQGTLFEEEGLRQEDYLNIVNSDSVVNPDINIVNSDSVVNPDIDTVNPDSVVNSDINAMNLVLDRNVLNDTISLDYFELVESEHEYSEIIIRFIDSVPQAVLVASQSLGTVPTELEASPRDPIESLTMEQPVLSVRPKEHLKREDAAEIGEEETGNYQYILRPKGSKFRHSASDKSVDKYKSKSDKVKDSGLQKYLDDIRKLDSNGKSDDKYINYKEMDDGQKPIRQLRKEAAEKKKALQEREKLAKTVEPQVKSKTVNPSNGTAEFSVTGSEKISIITDGTSNQEKMKITVEVMPTSEIQIVIQRVQGQWGS